MNWTTHQRGVHVYVSICTSNCMYLTFLFMGAITNTCSKLLLWWATSGKFTRTHAHTNKKQKASCCLPFLSSSHISPIHMIQWLILHLIFRILTWSPPLDCQPTHCVSLLSSVADSQWARRWWVGWWRDYLCNCTPSNGGIEMQMSSIQRPDSENSLVHHNQWYTVYSVGWLVE